MLVDRRVMVRVIFISLVQRCLVLMFPCCAVLSAPGFSTQQASTVGTKVAVFSEPDYVGWYSNITAPQPDTGCYNFWGELQGNVHSLQIMWNPRDLPGTVVCGSVIIWFKPGCETVTNSGFYFDIPGGVPDPKKFDYPNLNIRFK